MSGVVRVVVEGDGAGGLRVGSEGLALDVIERMLLCALQGVQRELLARRVVALQREGIVVTAQLPGDGGRGH